MSFVDEDPPKHYSVGELTSKSGHLSIYDIKEQRKHKFCVALNMDEIRVLAVKEGKVPFTSIFTSSKKTYKQALEVQARARQYLLEKSKTDDSSHNL